MKILLTAACCLAAFSASAISLTLTKALKERKVELQAHSTGGLQMNLVLRNKTAQELTILMDPALVFRPSDTGYQDMVVLGGQELALKARSQDSLQIKTFCGKSYARSPVKDLHYAFLHQGNEVMVRVAKYITVKQLPNNMVQHAIWSLTNGHNLNLIYDRVSERESILLAGFMATLMHQPPPQFFARTHISTKPDGRMVVSGMEEASVFLVLDVPATRRLMIEMYLENGNLYKEVRSYEMQDEGRVARVALDPKRIPAGTYIIRLRDEGNRIWEEKKVEIEAS